MKHKATLALFFMGTLSTPGMVFWNLDNSANQTDPGSGVPWGSVAAVSNNSTTDPLRSGSAIYLGDGYLLTANHVTLDATYSFVTFNGSDFLKIDKDFKSGGEKLGKQVTTGTPGEVIDMVVFKLETIPVGVHPVNLLTTSSELVAPATLIGWGVGRDPNEPMEDEIVNWGAESTSAKRWGVSTILAGTLVAYGSYSYNALVTVAGGTGPSFDPDGLGDSEASPTLLDSGSGLFQQIGGEWYLVGITGFVQQQGGSSTTTFGNDDTSGVGRGDRAYYARISDYDDAILNLIPEPGSVFLAALGFAFLFACRRRRAS
jgi:hypothetical protein